MSTVEDLEEVSRLGAHPHLQVCLHALDVVVHVGAHAVDQVNGLLAVLLGDVAWREDCKERDGGVREGSELVQWHIHANTALLTASVIMTLGEHVPAVATTHFIV